MAVRAILSYRGCFAVKKNESGFGNIIYGAVGLTIFLILITSVIMPTVMGANKTGWDAGSTALWGILGLVVVASAIMFVVGKK